MKLSKDLVVFDLETTGTWIEKDKIIEIAMIKIHPDGSKDSYHKIVNPQIPIPRVVSELIGITDDDVKDAPSFSSIAKDILDFIGESDFGGFNLERFDLPLLERELREAGHKFEWRLMRTFDAQKVYHINEKRDLSAAYKFYCDKVLNNAHTALADTQATLEILEAQVEKYGDEEGAIEKLLEFDYQKRMDFYDADRKFKWWNGKLYMMFGKYARKYSLQEVVKMDRNYCEWIKSSNFSDEVKTLVSDALVGKFPVCEMEEKLDLIGNTKKDNG